MLVDYAVTYMGYFDHYSGAAQRAKKMKRNVLTTFLLHIYQCITFNQTWFVKAILIAETVLKSFYSRLGFKVIKDVATSPNF